MTLKCPPASLFALATLLLSSACTTVGTPNVAEVAGAPVHYVTDGSGAPVVVFDAGAGDDRSSWNSVFPAIARQTTAFAFDRPGYGRHFGFGQQFESDADGKRTSEEVATHLRAALREAGLQPPYVLVGHSLGGLNMLAFAKLFPGEVRGVVLVDSRPPGFTAACRRAGIRAFVVPDWLVYTMPSQVRWEVRGLEASESFASDPGAFANVPVTVIAATRPDSPLVNQSDQAFWVDEQRAFAASLAHGRFVTAATRHYVHKEDPELVVSEILAMLTSSNR